MENLLPFPEPCPRPFLKLLLCLEPSADFNSDKFIVCILATINGLSQLKTPEEVAALRGLSVEELLG